MTRFPVFALLLLLIALPAAADDLTVAWIGRSPEMPYVWGSTNPTVEGWPAKGETVTWRAHVRSWSDSPRRVEYRWTVDGNPLSRGSVTVAPNSITTVDFTWIWTFDRHRIGFTIDADNVMAEESETNNSLVVFSDALSVGFWVEQSFYDYFRANQHKLGIGSTSFEDWAQRTITYFNDMAALAIYPETPDGLLDRMRLQKIVVVPDGALPLNGLPDDATQGSTGGTHPDKDDRTVDLMWGFRTFTLGRYADDFRPVPENDFYVGYAALHEIGHARYLVDLYAWNVTHRSGSEFQIEIRENGQSIVGNYIPRTGHATPEQGLMNAQYTFLDRYGAITWNRIAGSRAVKGNYNAPNNFASFLNDLPAQNRLTIRDENGNPIPNADVWFYYSVANGAQWYSTHYNNEPDLLLRTDANGQVLVGRSPFAIDGQVVHTFGMTNGVAIVRVATPDKVRYGFLESRLFNLAYWRGQTDFADHELMVGRECGADGPELAGPAWDTQQTGPVTLQWKPLAGATAYRVYASANLARPVLVGTTTGTALQVTIPGRVHWWVEADLGVCGSRRSATGLYEWKVQRRRAAGR